MAKIPYIDQYDIAEYINLQEAKLDCVEDVATLIETFFEASKSHDVTKFNSVVMDDEKYYYMVVNKNGGSFDLFSFIRDKFDSELNINCTNVKYLFPIKFSRGVYDDTPVTGNVEGVDDEDIPTSFLDEEDAGVDEEIVYTLYYPKTKTTFKIDRSSIILGRSPKKADFLIKDNTKIGRAHCSLYINENGKLMIHDFESLNGTFVNNARVSSSEDIEIHEGDIILLADEEFRVI